MAQVLKEEIEKRIIDSAIEEFFDKDYRTANMRDIAKKADIPTGLIYSYFKNKEHLFETIVEPIYHSIKMLLAEEQHDKNRPMENFFIQETDFLLNLLDLQRKQFIILVDKSGGTKYSDALKDIIELTQSHIKDHSKRELDIVNPIDDTFFHILANSFLESLVEIARHYKGGEWAKNMIKLLGMQFFYGIDGLK